MLSASLKYLSFFRKKSPDPETPMSADSFVTAPDEDTGRFINTNGKLTFARKIRRFSPFKPSRFFNMSSRRSAVSNWCSLDGDYMRSSLFSMTEYERGEYHIQSAVEQFDEDHEVFDETVRPREEEDWPPIGTSTAEFGIHGSVDVLTLVNHSGQDLEIDLGNLFIDPLCTDPPEVLSMLPDMSSMSLSITGRQPHEHLRTTTETSMQHTEGSTSQVTVTTTTVTKTSTKICFEPKGPIPERVRDGPSTSANRTNSINLSRRDRVVFLFVPPNEIRIHTLEFYNNAFFKRNYIAIVESTTNPCVIGVTRNNENEGLEVLSEPQSPTFSRQSTAFATDTESTPRLNEVPHSSVHNRRNATIESEVDVDSALQAATAQNNASASSNPFKTPVQREGVRTAERRRAMFYSDGVLPNASRFEPPVGARSSETSSLHGQEVAMLGNSSASDSSGDSSSDFASQPSTRPGSSMLSPRSGTVAELGMGVNSSDSDDGSSSDDSLSPPPSRSGSRLLSPSRAAEDYVRASGNRVATTLANRNLRQVVGNRFQTSIVPEPTQAITPTNPSVVRLRSADSSIRSSRELSPASPQQSHPESRPSTPSREAVDFLRSSGSRVASTLANRNLRLVHETRFETSVVSEPSETSSIAQVDTGVRMRGSTSSIRTSGEATPTRPGSASRPSTPSRRAVRFVRSLGNRVASTFANRNLAQDSGSRLQTSPLANGPTVTGVRMRVGCSSSGSSRSESTSPPASQQYLDIEENTPNAPELPLDEVRGYNIDEAEDLLRRLENLHVERVNEDSMVAQAGDVSMDDGRECNPHSVPIRDILPLHVNARVHSFVEHTEEVDRLSRTFGIRSTQFYSDPAIDSIDVRTPAGAALRALIETNTRLETEALSNRARISELLTQRHEPGESEDEGFGTSQPTTTTAHQPPIVESANVKAAPFHTRDQSEAASLDRLAPSTEHAQTHQNMSLLSETSTDSNRISSNPSDSMSNASTVGSSPTTDSDFSEQQKLTLSSAKEEDVVAAAQRMEAFLANKQKEVPTTSRFKTQRAVPTAEVAPTTEVIVDASPNSGTVPTAEEVTPPSNDLPPVPKPRSVTLSTQISNQETVSSPTVRVSPAVEVAPTVEVSSIVNATPAAASTAIVTPSTTISTPTTPVSASVSLPSNCSSQFKQNEISPAKDDEIAAAAKRMEAFLASKKNMAPSADSCTPIAPKEGTLPARTSTLNVDGAPTTDTTAIAGASLENGNLTTTSATSSSSPEPQTLSPAKDEEVAAAAKRMEAFLANKKEVPSASRFKAQNADPTTQTVPIGKTTSVVEVAATADAPEVASTSRDPTREPDNVAVEPTSEQVPKCSQSKQLELSPAKDDEVAAAARRMEAYLANKQKEVESANSSSTSQVQAAPTATITAVKVPKTNSTESTTVTADVVSNQPVTSSKPSPSSIPEPVSDASSSSGSKPQILSPAKDDEVVAAQKRMDEFLANKQKIVETPNRFKSSQSELTLEAAPSVVVAPKVQSTAEATATMETALDTPTLRVPPNSPITDAPTASSQNHSESRSQESLPTPSSEPSSSASLSEAASQNQQILSPSPPLQEVVTRQDTTIVTNTSPDVTSNVATEDGMDGSNNTRRSAPPPSKTPTSQSHTPMFFATMTTTYPPPLPEAPLKLQFPHTTCDLALGLSQIFAQKESTKPVIIPTMKDANMPRSERGKLPLTTYQYLPSLFGPEITLSYGIIAKNLCQRLEEVLAENPQLSVTNTEAPFSAETDPSNMQLYYASSNSPRKSALRKPDLFDNVPDWFHHAITPCPSPVPELSFDKSIRPPKPKLTKEQIRTRYRRPINLVFPRECKCVRWSDYMDDKPSDDSQKSSEENQSGFRIISIVDKKATVAFPTEPYPNME